MFYKEFFFNQVFYLGRVWAQGLYSAEPLWPVNLSDISRKGPCLILLSLYPPQTTHIPTNVKQGPHISADGTFGHGSKEHNATDMWWADFANRLQEKND